MERLTSSTTEEPADNGAGTGNTNAGSGAGSGGTNARGGGFGAGTGRPGRDRATRQAALWATAVAVPLSLLVAFLLFARLSPDSPNAAPDPAASPRPQSTAPVEVVAPALAEGPAVICRALLSRMPANLRDLAQRPVSAGPEQNAAYGDPPLTVACGVPPATFPPTDDVWSVNNVCWYAAPPAAGAVVLTTADREVPVRVTVPQAYEQPLQWVAPVSMAIAASIRSAATTPFGCTP